MQIPLQLLEEEGEDPSITGKKLREMKLKVQ